MRAHMQGIDVSTLLGVRLETKEPAGRAYTAYPNSANVRWLIPANQPILRRVSIGGLYQPNSLRGRAVRRIMGAGALRGEKVWLEEEALARLETSVAPVVGGGDLCLAFYLGVPAPHRKVTAQVLTPDGETLAYAKIATSPLAQSAVRTERRTLLRLSESADLYGKVPRVLGSFDWKQGIVLIITTGPPRPGPSKLTRTHSRFCAEVFQSFREEGAFSESPMWTSMSEIWFRLKQNAPETLPVHLGPALEWLHHELGPVRMPLSLAHGDFVPWNTRMGSLSLFVFDWERASEGMIPLYDAFHFQALQAALQGRRPGIRDRRFLLDLSNTLWPEGAEDLSRLYLAYLAHVCLLYSEAQSLAPGVGERKVWHWFAQQIENVLKGEVQL
jgi:hypothetical protein